MAFRTQKVIHTPAGTLIAPNTISRANGWHLSYNGSVAGYGCVTTALVFENRVFFVLEGDHRKAWGPYADAGDLDGALGYFMVNESCVHRSSEHLMALGLREDPFELAPTVRKSLGDMNYAAVREFFHHSDCEGK